MRVATTVEASQQPWQEIYEFVVEAEHLGLDICWVAEAWGSDAPSVLGFLAAWTDRLLLGSGVFQVGIRTPVTIAMTALTLARISDGRFLLGLGSTGPQVIEGLHGQSFASPLTRMRETIDVIRQALAGDKIDYSGIQFKIPRPGGHGRPMRLSLPANSDLPIYIASMSPKMLELTGQEADGWLGTSFVPEGSGAYFEHLDAGLAHLGTYPQGSRRLPGCRSRDPPRRRRRRGPRPNTEERTSFQPWRNGIGGRQLLQQRLQPSRLGRRRPEIRHLWQAGDRDGASALVTDEMVLSTTLIGTEAMVRERLRVWHDAGVDTVRLYPTGTTTHEKLDTLARAIELVRTVE